MKIAILNSARKFIGEAAHCLALAEQLRARGHEATLIVRRGFELEKRALERGVPVLPLTFNSGFHPITDGRDLLALRRFIREFRPDILHCHRGKDHWLAAAATFGCRATSEFRRPGLVRTRHVVVPMATHVLNRWLLTRRTAQIIAVSQATAASLGPLAKALAERLHVILSAVDTQRFSPARRSEALRSSLGAHPETLLVGLIARLQRIKGQEVFLKAAADVARDFPATRFLIAGRGTEQRFARLRALADELGIGARVEFRGWLEDVEATIASLDVGVVASLGSEGSSRITYECMASGVPMAATAVGGIPEILSDGGTGLLVPPGDEAALAAAIRRLLESEVLRQTLSQAGLKRVQKHHTHDRWIADTLAVYRQATEEGRRP